MVVHPVTGEGHRPSTRFARLYEAHATQTLLFATALTGDPDKAKRLTDDAIVRLGARFADRRHPESFHLDFHRLVVRLAASRRERTPGSRRDVLARAAAILRSQELNDEQIGLVLEVPTRRVADLVERGTAGYDDAVQSGRPALAPVVPPSARLERRWREARFRTSLAALVLLSWSATGGMVAYRATDSGSRSTAARASSAQPVVAARIPLTGGKLDDLFLYNGPGEMAAADGIVWVGGHFGVVGVDAGTNQIVKVLARSEGIGFGGGLAAGDGAVLAADGNSALIEPPGGAVRIDPETATPGNRFDLAGTTLPHGAAIGEGSGWLAALNIGIYRLDLGTMEPIATVPLRNPQAVAIGYGSVWAATSMEADSYIAKIDPGTNEVVASTPVRNVFDLAAGEGAVWGLTSGWEQESGPPKSLPIVAQEGGLVRIDPKSGQVEWIKQTFGRALAVGAGAVWVVTYDGTIGATAILKKIDPATGNVLAELDLGAGAVDLCVLDGSVWALDANDRTLIRVDV